MIVRSLIPAAALALALGGPAAAMTTVPSAQGELPLLLVQADPAIRLEAAQQALEEARQQLQQAEETGGDVEAARARVEAAEAELRQAQESTAQQSPYLQQDVAEPEPQQEPAEEEVAEPEPEPQQQPAEEEVAEPEPEPQQEQPAEEEVAEPEPEPQPAEEEVAEPEPQQQPADEPEVAEPEPEPQEAPADEEEVAEPEPQQESPAEAQQTAPYQVPDAEDRERAAPEEPQRDRRRREAGPEEAPAEEETAEPQEPAADERDEAAPDEPQRERRRREAAPDEPDARERQAEPRRGRDGRPERAGREDRRDRRRARDLPDRVPDDGEVVRREGDRIIIQLGDQLTIRKDENERLRRFGRQAETEEIGGGWTRTVLTRPNGAEVITIRDEFGEVVRRVRRLPDGREIVLFDTREPERPVRPDWESRLPPLTVTIPREEYIVEMDRASEADIRTALTAPPVEEVERVYTLREVRQSERLRDKVRRVDLDTITFEFNSADIASDQIPALASIGRALEEVLDADPGEVYLLEGHTDAVGSDFYNLELSDRRAESVAIALSENFDVPPENLVTQGYGEQYLKVPTEEPERENRRVTIRRITPLISSAQ